VKFLKTIIVALLVAGLLSIAQHHHDDFDEHDDCPVCALVQNGLDVACGTTDVAVILVVIGELVSEIRVFKTNPHFHFSRPRAPPILST
jgi:hypothetical protein